MGAAEGGVVLLFVHCFSCDIFFCYRYLVLSSPSSSSPPLLYIVFFITIGLIDLTPLFFFFSFCLFMYVCMYVCMYICI